MTDRRYRINAPQVVAETVDDEVIAINMATGVYFTMRGWSAYVWSLLAGGHTPAESQELLTAAIGTAANGAVEGFVTAILDDDLLAPDDAASPVESPAVTTDEWNGLALERFTDMTDLILLDPVHDVSPTDGWPTIAPRPT